MTLSARFTRRHLLKEVFGIKAVAGGKELYIKANKGVLLATGSVSGSPELMERFFLPKGVEVINSSSPRQHR